MRSRSAYDLINDVRSRSDQQTLNGQLAYITDDEILEWLNQAWAELYDLQIKTGEHYYLKQQNFQTVNGDTSVPLPDDYYKTMGVDVQVGAMWQTAHQFQFERRNDYQVITGSWNWPTEINYAIWGQNLQFMPIPNGSYPVRHWYYPAPVRLTLNDGGTPPGSVSSIDGVSGWEQFAIDWAAQKCAERDENVDLSSMLGRAIDQKRAHILKMAATRNPGEAPMTRIVRGRGGSRGRRGGFGGGRW